MQYQAQVYVRTSSRVKVKCPEVAAVLHKTILVSKNSELTSTHETVECVRIGTTNWGILACSAVEGEVEADHGFICPQ
jgi:hypothetical protein